MGSKHEKSHTRAYILSIAIIVFVTFVIYSRQVFGGSPFISVSLFKYLPWRFFATEQDLERASNYMLSDPLTLTIPVYAYAKSCLLQLKLPLWNPNMLSGYPFGSIGSVALFYPPNWFYLLFDPEAGLLISAMGRTILAGFFMLLYLRYLGLDERAALFGAVCFMLNGFFIVWNEFTHHIEAAIWLPLIFLFTEKLLREREKKYILFLSLTIAINIVACMFQVALYNLYAAGFYALFRGISRRKMLGSRELWLFWGRFACALILAVVLSAVQILPFYELMTNSNRMVVDLEREFSQGVMPPVFMVQYIIPEFFGSPPENNFWFVNMLKYMKNDPSISEGWLINLVELNGYTGLIVLFFGFMALSARKKHSVWLFAGLCVLSLSPIFSKAALSFFYYVIPGFKTSWPGRLIFIYMFALIVLASIGFDHVINSKQEQENLKKHCWVLLTCIAMVVCAALFLIFVGYTKQSRMDMLHKTLLHSKNLSSLASGYYSAMFFLSYFWSNTVRAILVFVITVVCFGLSFFLFRRNKIGPNVFAFLIVGLTVLELFHFYVRFHPAQKGKPYFKTESIEFLEENLGYNRFARLIRWDILPYDTGLYFGLRDAQGYVPMLINNSSDTLKLLGKRAVMHERWAPFIETGEALEGALVDLMGIKYVLADKNTELSSEKFHLVFEDGIRIYENTEVFPRAFFVSEYVVSSSRDFTLKALANGEIDLGEKVILDENPGSIGPADTSASQAKVAIEQESPNEIELMAEVPSAGLLVLTDTFYPGWKVYVDGVEKKIYRAYHTYRAVRLETGTHEVRFVYKPFSLKLGGAISGIALLAFAAPFLVTSALSRFSGKGKDDGSSV